MSRLPTQSVSRETPLRPKLPLKLGRFTLCEELGAGGMATVYLARMELAAGLDRLVALKTIHPHLAREKAFVDMFLDEARIASHVSHPNVCAVHDFGEVGGVYYLAMEHLIGEPLFDVINRLVDRFDEVRDVLPFLAARVIADACEGLHAAHTARGPDGTRLHIVHRDVSPQNLFITYDGSVKVVDFGCAKAAQRVAHTSTGVMKGKVGYAAPEQLRADDVDARADVWALGVCLWEALTLSPLFTKETAMKTAMSVLEEPIVSAAHERPWVPEEVAEIAAKALHRDREDRYPSARAMGRDLRKFIADSGFTLESAELAEWMAFLFEDRHEERLQQAARAREVDVTGALEALPEMLGDVEAADVELLPDTMSAMEAIVAHEERMAIPSAPPPLPRQTPAPPPRRSSRRRWLALLASLVVLGAGAYYLHLNYELAPWVLELAGLSTAPAQSPNETLVAPAPVAPQTDDPLPAGSPPAPSTSARDQTEESAAPQGATESTSATAPPPARDAPSSGSGGTPASDREPEEPTRPRGARPRGGGSGGGGGIVTTVVSGGGTDTVEGMAAAPASAPASGGVVHIVAASGWADVYLGGRRLGRTPLRQHLPAGHHRLRLLPYGQEPALSLEVDVMTDVDERLEIDLPPPPADSP